MINPIERNKLRVKRHLRTRKKISGTSEIPRLYIFRSLKTIYANIVDDDKGATIASASISKKDSSSKLAELLLEKTTKLGISKVVFDKSGYKYHGRIKEFADSLRDKGLKPKITTHLEIDEKNGIHCTTGSLGHGFPIATGMAFARKKRGKKGKIFVLISDGECQEGTTWESLLIASKHKLNNLTFSLIF